MAEMHSRSTAVGNGFYTRCALVGSSSQAWSNLCLCRSILLGSRGFDVPKLSQRLETLNAAKSLDAIEPVWETDIEVGHTGGRPWHHLCMQL